MQPEEKKMFWWDFWEVLDNRQRTAEKEHCSGRDAYPKVIYGIFDRGQL